ncbi:hypothetical protein MRB53_002277 [Persea americana]|uniref:Uncharacterized protein n=1 Tax=Persea americana TaxID=3435 RepID=A0ACC2MU53_PERAE|nr:hypothetical protein MRB53_002277 [Persea americana]
MALWPTTLLPNSKLNSGAGETPVAFKMLLASTKSLSVSLPGESFSLPINSNYGRKATPERRRATSVRGKIDGVGGDQLEDSK